MSMKYNNVKCLYENIFEVAFNEKIIDLLENVLGRKISDADSEKISRYTKGEYFNSGIRHSPMGELRLDLVSTGDEVYTLVFHRSVRHVDSRYIMTSPELSGRKQNALYVDIRTSGNSRAIISNIPVIPPNGFCNVPDSYLEEKVAEIEKMVGFDIEPPMAYVIRTITKDIKGIKGQNFSYIEKLCPEKNLFLQISLVDGDVSYSIQETS